MLCVECAHMDLWWQRAETARSVQGITVKQVHTDESWADFTLHMHWWGSRSPGCSWKSETWLIIDRRLMWFISWCFSVLAAGTRDNTAALRVLMITINTQYSGCCVCLLVSNPSWQLLDDFVIMHSVQLSVWRPLLTVPCNTTLFQTHTCLHLMHLHLHGKIPEIFFIVSEWQKSKESMNDTLHYGKLYGQIYGDKVK